MLIGVDIDEVLAEFLNALIKFHNEKYKTKLKKQDFFTYEFYEIWGGDKEESINKIYKFHKTDYFKNIKPVPGAKKGIKELQKNNELIIITSRQNIIKKETKNWLEKHFPNAFSKIYFGNQHAKTGKSVFKYEICQRLKVDLLIEDSLEYAYNCVSNKTLVLLFDNYWNQCKILPKNIHRVFSWDDITKFINNLNKR